MTPPTPPEASCHARCGQGKHQFAFTGGRPPHGSTLASKTQKVVEEILALLFKPGFHPATLRGAVSALRAVHLYQTWNVAAFGAWQKR